MHIFQAVSKASLFTLCRSPRSEPGPPPSQVTVLFKKFARQAAPLGPGWRCVGAAEGGGLSPGHRLVKYKSELRNVTLNQPRPGLALIRLT